MMLYYWINKLTDSGTTSPLDFIFCVKINIYSLLFSLLLFDLLHLQKKVW